MTRVVVKVGGAVTPSAPETILSLAAAHDVCVVHGGGPQISAELERRGLGVTFVGGRRVTTPQTLIVVRKVLLGINHRLVAALGPRAEGLVGDEVGLQAKPVPGLGLVGEALPSRPAAIEDAFARGRIPVVAPLAAGPLNVNADDAASALAVGLGAERVLFVMDAPGVLLEGGVVAALAADEAEGLLAAGAFQGGIVPKLEAAVAAARLGVAAHIGATAVMA